MKKNINFHGNKDMRKEIIIIKSKNEQSKESRDAKLEKIN